MIKYVYVDVETLKANEKHNACSPPILVTGGGNNEAPRAGCRVRVNGPCEILYLKSGVLPAGGAPHVAVITLADVEIITEYRK